MVVVLFQLIFLNKTKSSSCRDHSPNSPFQNLNIDEVIPCQGAKEEGTVLIQSSRSALEWRDVSGPG